MNKIEPSLVDIDGNGPFWLFPYATVLPRKGCTVFELAEGRGGLVGENRQIVDELGRGSVRMVGQMSETAWKRTYYKCSWLGKDYTSTVSQIDM